jgi:hypothetical protein
MSEKKSSLGGKLRAKGDLNMFLVNRRRRA